jgi:hypothetical protein
MLMLNEKSCIDCDEFEFNKHSEEIDELMERLMELEDYDWETMGTGLFVIKKRGSAKNFVPTVCF